MMALAAETGSAKGTMAGGLLMGSLAAKVHSAKELVSQTGAFTYMYLFLLLLLFVVVYKWICMDLYMGQCMRKQQTYIHHFPGIKFLAVAVYI